MKIIIFDLKDTLIKENGAWVDGAEDSFDLSVLKADQTLSIV